jgi:hypothetical protein
MFKAKLGGCFGVMDLHKIRTKNRREGASSISIYVLYLHAEYFTAFKSLCSVASAARYSEHPAPVHARQERGPCRRAIFI